jgi:hypothetical protein
VLRSHAKIYYTLPERTRERSDVVDQCVDQLNTMHYAGRAGRKRGLPRESGRDLRITMIISGQDARISAVRRRSGPWC